jgi:hypothetical protein
VTPAKELVAQLALQGAFWPAMQALKLMVLPVKKMKGLLSLLLYL